MCSESMSLVSGKFKLPVLKGEQGLSVQHFRRMEELVASDLNFWLCNIYLEVRPVSLTELGASEAMLKVRLFFQDTNEIFK